MKLFCTKTITFLFLILCSNGIHAQTEAAELFDALVAKDTSIDLTAQNIDSLIQLFEFEELCLLWASAVGVTDVCKELIDRGTNVDYMIGGPGTALMLASYHGYIEIVILLLDNGASVNLQGNGEHGYSALIQASQGGHTKIAMLLLDRGAKVDLQDAYGETALIYASLEGYTELVKLLLDNKVKLDLQNINGKTALMAAVINGHSEIAKLLLDKGSDTDIKDNLGNTALDYTRKN